MAKQEKLLDPFAQQDNQLIADVPPPGADIFAQPPQNETVIQKTDQPAPAFIEQPTEPARIKKGITPVGVEIKTAPAQIEWPQQQQTAPITQAKQTAPTALAAPTTPATPAEPPVVAQFKQFIQSNPDFQRAWRNASAKQRLALAEKFADYKVNQDLLKLQNDPKFRKLKRGAQSAIVRRLYHAYKSKAMLYLTPQAMGATPAELDTAPLELVKKVAKDVPLEADEIYTRFKTKLAESTRLKNFWDRSTPTEQQKFIDKYLESNVIIPALEQFRKSSAYKRLTAKQRKEVEKRIRERLKAEGNKAFLGLPGTTTDELLADEKAVDRVGAISKPTHDPGFLSALWNSVATGAVQGAAETVTGLADLGSLANENIGDNAFVNWARKVAETNQKKWLQGIPEEERRTHEEIGRKIEEGDILGAAWQFITSPEYAAYYTANMLGWVVGSGGLVGGARAAAAKGAAVAAAKLSGRALRLSKAAKATEKALKASKVKTTAPYVGFVAGAGAQAGDDAYRQVKSMSPDTLRTTPAWAKMERQLTATLGRAPTDAEVQEALARSARKTATALGSAASAASFLIFGGVPERFLASSFKELGAGGIARSVGREAGQEFIESGGQAAAAKYAATGDTQQAYQEALKQGAFGGIVGGLVGGAFGAAGKYAGLDPDTPLDRQDPDIAAAREAVQVANAKMTETAAEMAGLKHPQFRPMRVSRKENGEIVIMEGDQPFLEQRNGKWFMQGQEVNPAEDPMVAATLVAAENMLALKPGTLISTDDIKKAQEVLKATDETIPPEDDYTIALTIDKDAKLAGEETQTEPAPPVTEQAPTVDVEAFADLPKETQKEVFFAYMKTLLDAGEPWPLALNSTRRTFGAKPVNALLKEMFDANMSMADILEEIKATDPQLLAAELKHRYKLQGDARHTSIVQRALRETGVGEGIIVVHDAAEMPGMAPNLPLATFRLNGGKDTFTVLNAAAINRMPIKRMRSTLKALILGHELARKWLSENTQAKLYAAAVELMEQKGTVLTYKTKQGRGVDVSPARARQFLQQTEEGEYKVKKARTSEEVYKWFYEKLREGDIHALAALKRVMKESGIKGVDRLSAPQLFRVLMEADVIPATDAGVIMSVPPKRRGASREPGPTKTPATRKTTVQKEVENVAKAAKKQTGKQPVAITPTGWLMKAIKWSDDNAKLTVLRSLADRLPEESPLREAIDRFVAAARARQTRMSQNMALAQELMHKLYVTADVLAKQAGYEDVTTFLNEVMLYRVARHAIERNPVQWALHTPLKNKEAIQERQALADRILRGEAGNETLWQRIFEIAQEHGTEHPDTIYAGLSNVEAEDIVNQAKKSGKAQIFEELDPLFDQMAAKIKEWRELAGTYAGPAKNVIDAYGWKYYTPLVDVNAKGDKYVTGDEQDLLGTILNAPTRMRSRRGKKKKEIQGRIDLDGVNIDSWHVELRNAALAAANAETAQAALKMVKLMQDAGDVDYTFGTIEDLGSLEYKSAGGSATGPGWKIPSGSELNPHAIVVYDPEDQHWKRVIFTDAELARIVRNEYEEDAFLNHWLIRKTGIGTRILGRTYTTFRPAFWATSTIRDQIQTALLLWSQEGVSPIKFNWETVKRVASSVRRDGYVQTMWKFLTATPMEQEKLANDPEFLKRPGAKYLVERWRNGGIITFADYIAETQNLERAATVKSIEQAAPWFKRTLQRLRGRSKAMDALLRVIEAPDQIMTLLDNFHRQVAYDLLREHGMSEQDAADWSRRLMDFGRSSRIGRRLNAFYAFSQAGLTGIGTMLDNHVWKNGVPPLAITREGDQIVVRLDKQRALSEFNWKLAASLMIMGAASVTLTYMLLGEDEDGRPKADSIKPGTWMNYLITPLGTYGPEGNSPAPVKIPLQYGPSQLFYGIGAMAGLIMNGNWEFRDLLYAYTNQLLKNLIPFGNFSVPAELATGETATPGDLVKTFLLGATPTALVPPMEIALNRNVFGGQVHKNLDYTLGRAAHDLGYIGTPDVWSDAAEFINNALSTLGLKPSVYPEDVELFVRDMVPLVGPLLAAGPRFWINFMERPDRTSLEAILTSGLVPMPGLVLDYRYRYYDVERRLRARYYQPAKDALKAAQAMPHGPDRERMIAKVHREYPWLRPIKSLDQKFGRTLQKLRAAIHQARKEGDHVKAERLWLQYQELQRERTRRLIRIFEQYGVKP